MYYLFNIVNNKLSFPKDDIVFINLHLLIEYVRDKEGENVYFVNVLPSKYKVFFFFFQAVTLLLTCIT